MNLDSGKEQKIVYLSLIAAMVFGLYLRMHNIALDGLWLDEAFSVATSGPDNSLLDVCRRTLRDVHPAFYQVVLWGVYKVFGFGEMVGRYLSVVFGVLLIPVMYFLGRQLFSQYVGLIVAWLATINFYLITYSQETRSYSLLVLLTTASFVLFIAAVRKPEIKNLVAYTLISAMLVNTHYFGFLPVAAQVMLFLIVLIKSPLDKVLLYKFGAAGVFVCLSLLPSAFYIWTNFERQGFWIPKPNDRFFLDLFVLYFGGLSLSVLCAALLVIGLARLAADENKKEVLLFLMVWLLVCTVVPYARSVYFEPVLTMRNMIVVLPVMLLLLAYAIDLFKSRKAQGCLGIFILCFSMTPIYTEYKPVYTLENQMRPISQLREAVRFMADECVGCPVYALGDAVFEVCFKLLGYSLRVYSVEDMKKDLMSVKRPDFFYVAVSRADWRPSDDDMKRYNFRLVGENIIGDTPVRKYESLPLTE